MTPQSYADFEAGHRKLAILRLLAEDAGYSANDSVIRAAIQPLGFTVSRDRVRTDLAWLAEQGLVTIEDIAHLKVAKLTERGGDVASGAARVDGVERPSPRG